VESESREFYKKTEFEPKIIYDTSSEKLFFNENFWIAQRVVGHMAV
jgi:hypothetical protein